MNYYNMKKRNHEKMLLKKEVATKAMRRPLVHYEKTVSRLVTE